MGDLCGAIAISTGIFHVSPLQTDLIELHYIKDLRLDSVASILFDKGIELILSTPGDEHLCIIEDELLSQRLSNAGGGADDEDAFIFEGHFVGKEKIQ